MGLFHFFRTTCEYFFEVLFIIPLIAISYISRTKKKKFQIGLGPEPLINNVYHKKALNRYGYSAETFVNELYFITKEFDIIYSRELFSDFFSKKFYTLFPEIMVYCKSIFRYQCIYFYFNGGPLYSTKLLWKLEPFFFHIAKIKTVVMPYGGDVQNLSLCPNLLYKHTMGQSYPLFRMRKQMIEAKIDLWTRNADHIISGCDWVYYMHYWDTLMLGHFSIDTEKLCPSLDYLEKKNDVIKILHAPNHRAIKGTQFFIDAVDDLKKEGYNIELIIIEKKPNYEVIDLIKTVDIVADQLIVGWYAMFALEAMALGKPVICYLRSDLENLFIFAGLLKKNESPFISCDAFNIKENLRHYLQNPSKLNELGKKSREYVEKHHSLESVGAIFSKINKQLNIFPEQNE